MEPLVPDLNAPVPPTRITLRRFAVLTIGVALLGALLLAWSLWATIHQQEALSKFAHEHTLQRDQERRETQAQLDEQRRVLCLTVIDIGKTAGPHSSPVLLRAASDLHCSDFSPTPTTGG